MNLHEVNKGIHKFKKRKRLGRGPGSGHGKTSGRGHKGQKSRGGYKALSIFQGGAMPLVRRVPKRGFTNSFARNIAAINIGALEENFNSGDEVSPEILKQRGLVKHRYELLKILGDGELTKSLKVSAHRFSKSASETISKAGGTVTVLAGPTPVEEKKKQQKKEKTQASS